MKAFPNIDEDEYYARELASFYRSDLILFCSDYEKYMAEKHYDIPSTGLVSFFYPRNSVIDPSIRTFERRKNFVWIGNL